MQKGKLHTELEERIGQYVQENNHLNKLDIAAHFNADPELVLKIAHACGVRLARVPRKRDEKNIGSVEFIRNNSHMTLKELSKELNRSYRYVRSLAETHNLPYKRERTFTPRPSERINGNYFNITARENWLI